MRILSRAELAKRDRLFAASDRELAERYWEARGQLALLRAPSRREASGEELAIAFMRVRELEALCELLWRESRRRTLAGSIQAEA